MCGMRVVGHLLRMEVGVGGNMAGVWESVHHSSSSPGIEASTASPTHLSTNLLPLCNLPFLPLTVSSEQYNLVSQVLATIENKI